MRIIRGTAGGRRISPPKSFKARPTTDIAKEALFNVLDNRYYFEDMEVLDLFSGTGSISYEFASRGCKLVYSVEKDYKSYDFIRTTAISLNLANITSIRADAFKFIDKTGMSFSLIFADPPYDLPELATLPDKVFARKTLKPGGLFILEHGSTHDFSQHPHFKEVKNYSKLHFSFFEWEKDPVNTATD